MKRKQLSRRMFLAGTAAVIAGCKTRGPGIITTKSPNERLNVAGIGVGGQGHGDLSNVVRDTENLVALCDVDWDRASNSFNRWPDATKYKDFRVMLDKEAKNIDAVVVATPDHMHAFAAMAAMELGKHVYVEKPLTHSISEARVLLKAARRYRVATQMGNQGHSGEGVRQMCEMIWAGFIGEVKEAHIWTDRSKSHISSGWIQGQPNPLPEEPIPDTLDWNQWIGPAPMRPYNHGYCPFAWRGWWDFGCGALGDMGCHIMDPAFWALDLSEPASVECIHQKDKNDQTGPSEAIVKYEFPARHNRFAKKKMGPVDVYWYEGGLKPKRPEGVSEDEKLGDDSNGSLFFGENGVLTAGCYGGDSRLVPAAQMEARKGELENVPKVLPRVRGSHHQSWVNACKTGEPSASNFEYAVPLTEMVLLGNLAMRSGEKVYWDAKNMCATNNVPNVEQYVKREYREGWTL
ncbi:MAG: Gfo/Idh/MocA family oxidoreductase [Candidatus Hydrogenedentes bacterium]|nr:Gfo/Idh/MocA family oxidoreductase [Candidatus Hydrogenedentota bacterium]